MSVIQSQLLRSSSSALDELTEMTAISVIQREFTEKRRRLVRQNEVRSQDRKLLGQNLSREILEKTIQIARRFAAMRTTNLWMAIDPEFASSTAKTSGGQDNQVFLNTELETLLKGTCFPTLHGHVDKGIKSMCPPMPDA